MNRWPKSIWAFQKQAKMCSHSHKNMSHEFEWVVKLTGWSATLEWVWIAKKYSKFPNRQHSTLKNAQKFWSASLLFQGQNCYIKLKNIWTKVDSCFPCVHSLRIPKKVLFSPWNIFHIFCIFQCFTLSIILELFHH